MLQSVCIDTIYLVSHLDFRHIAYLQRHFQLVPGKHYHHVAFSKKPYFCLQHMNRDLYRNMYYDTTLMMQRDILGNLPSHVLELLHLTDWKVQRMDIAFDFNTPISNHFLLKSRDNVLVKHYGGTQNYYVFSPKSKNRALIYDKKRQLLFKKGIHSPYKYLTRFEVRTRPKLSSQQYLQAMNFEWLQPYFSKYDFVEDLYQLPISTNDQALLRTIMRRSNKDWGKIVSRKRKAALQEVIRENSVDIWAIFNAIQHDLFNWFPQHPGSLSA